MNSNIKSSQALKLANLSVSDISLWEFNEAFSVVAMINQKVCFRCVLRGFSHLNETDRSQLLGLDPAKVNPYGGAVSLGHPIG